jgi:hypothetical protein
VTDRMVGRGRLIPIVPRSSRRWFIVTEMWVAPHTGRADEMIE